MDNNIGSDVSGGSNPARPATTTGAFGPNAWLVEDMYDSYRADPTSVSESWREFFTDYRPAVTPAGGAPAGGAPAPAAPAPAPTPAKSAPAAKTSPPGAASNGTSAGEKVTPLRGAAGRIVINMQASLEVPTATSVRAVSYTHLTL